MRPPTVIDPGRLIAGRHPSAGPEEPDVAVEALLEQGVTLFVDLTHEGELEPYDRYLPAHVRHERRAIRDFSVPTPDRLVEILDTIDAELAEGGVVYVHCWAGCGRTGVVVGSWLVRHGMSPQAALDRVAEVRGLGCPQTLEQRLLVLDWEAGR